ncbi:MAG: RtcB family protein, partial [Nanoarchaeota archaeon]
MDIKKIAPYVWEIPQTGKMNVPGRVFASDALMDKIKQDNTLQQTANVATLPGILGYSIAMPDAHQGYGFPVGGVAAFDSKEGIISPGGVGFDINCGVRLLRTDWMDKDIASKKSKLLEAFMKGVPAGAGMAGRLKITKDELQEVLAKGIDWAKANDYASKDDKARTEEEGRMMKADPSLISANALARGLPQLGTLGSGNHFLEIQRVDKIFMPDVARQFGITQPGQVVVMVHCGSRGLGHQVCSDYIERIERELGTKHLADPELASAALSSDIGQDYYGAMCASINFAFTNRQMISHYIRDAFERVMGSKDGIDLVYDVCHNIAKFEKHRIDGKTREVCVHRKGATRAF